jgi:hypothetical protein
VEGNETRVTIGEVVKIGADLKAKLELLARQENGDATWLARRVLRGYVEKRPADEQRRDSTARG